VPCTEPTPPTTEEQQVMNPPEDTSLPDNHMDNDQISMENRDSRVPASNPTTITNDSTVANVTAEITQQEPKGHVPGAADTPTTKTDVPPPV